MTGKKQKNNRTFLRIAVLALVGLVFICFACTLILIVVDRVDDSASRQAPEAPITDPSSAILVLAYSPEKADLVVDLVQAFNDTRQRSPDDELMQVRLVELAPDQMVEAALGDTPGFQALTPDASLWLDQLDLRWAEIHRDGESDIAPRRVADSSRYAVSPIVIAAWPEVAQVLRGTNLQVGWTDLQARAAEDDGFRWSHASTSYASGMLATLAEFYAGAGKTRALSEEDVLKQETLDYVRDVESTISLYGENEATAMQRMRDQGRDYLDALIVMEALVAQHNQAGNDPLVAIYPREGTLWEDHPLALLDDPSITDNQRRTFIALSEFLRRPEQQKHILARGFRPADLSIPLDSPGSPISIANGVDPKEPQTTLQMPGPTVVDVVQNAWWYTKRPSNVFLVVDTSGSMEGDKIENVRAALDTFVDQIQGTQDRVGMVEFAGTVYNIIPLAVIDDVHRQTLEQSILSLYAGGDTALLDAVRAAYVRMQREGDTDRINAIVAMTDGQENASGVDLADLMSEIARENDRGVPVVIFAIGYGNDADFAVLNALAEVSGGQAREGDIETISELYRLLSQYF
ncbi:MAG: VWA domain-containing protein [Chloroflexi bacterium]|nr:VWA domain-containing protein [Chloroflexota bacterium]